MKNIQEHFEEINAFDLKSIADILKRPDILGKIRFDVTPQMIMAPQVFKEGEKSPDLRGYMFYIETYEPPPTLMLMRVGRSGVTSTTGSIKDAPAEMIRRAVEQPAAPPCNKMCAISDEIREWLRRELDL